VTAQGAVFADGEIGAAEGDGALLGEEVKGESARAGAGIWNSKIPGAEGLGEAGKHSCGYVAEINAAPRTYGQVLTAD